MGDRATLEKIYAIMRRLLLVPMDGANPIPRKGTTRHECYRALYEIQELLETRRYFGKHLPQTNADRIRSMKDEELAELLTAVAQKSANKLCESLKTVEVDLSNCNFHILYEAHLDWLKQEATD